MKVRFSEHMTNNPVVEIMPNSGNFDTLDAVITVSFFDFNDEGKRIYKPSVRANVSFGNRMQPEQALFWGDCFKVAYEVATRAIPSYVEHYQKDEIVNAFMRVDEIESKIKQ